MYNEPLRFTQNKLFFVFFHSSCCVERHEPLKYKIYCLKIKYCAKTSYPSIPPIHLEFIYIKFSHFHNFPTSHWKLFSHAKKGAWKIIACDGAAYTRELLEFVLYSRAQWLTTCAITCFILSLINILSSPYHLYYYVKKRINAKFISNAIDTHTFDFLFLSKQI